MEHNIVEGNVLIAIFMGFEKRFYKNPAYPEPYYDNAETRQYELCENQFKYHTDWNWLMPVVEKIKELKIEDFTKKKPVMNALYDVDIKILWLACISFIKYYNETIKTKP